MKLKSHFDMEFLISCTEKLRSIAHPARIAIIDLLHRHNEMSVTEIYEQLAIEQAVASHHLRILKDKKVVNVKREGKNSLYSLSHKDFHSIIDIMAKVV